MAGTTLEPNMTAYADRAVHMRLWGSIPTHLDECGSNLSKLGRCRRPHWPNFGRSCSIWARIWPSSARFGRSQQMAKRCQHRLEIGRARCSSVVKHKQVGHGTSAARGRHMGDTRHSPDLNEDVGGPITNTFVVRSTLARAGSMNAAWPADMPPKWRRVFVDRVPWPPHLRAPAGRCAWLGPFLSSGAGTARVRLRQLLFAVTTSRREAR